MTPKSASTTIEHYTLEYQHCKKCVFRSFKLTNRSSSDSCDIVSRTSFYVWDLSPRMISTSSPYLSLFLFRTRCGTYSHAHRPYQLFFVSQSVFPFFPQLGQISMAECSSPCRLSTKKNPHLTAPYTSSLPSLPCLSPTKQSSITPSLLIRFFFHFVYLFVSFPLPLHLT